MKGVLIVGGAILAVVGAGFAFDRWYNSDEKKAERAELRRQHEERCAELRRQHEERVAAHQAMLEQKKAEYRDAMQKATDLGLKPLIDKIVEFEFELDSMNNKINYLQRDYHSTRRRISDIEDDLDSSSIVRI